MLNASRRFWVVAVSVVALASAAFMYSCGSGTKSTAPGGGGGGAELNSGNVVNGQVFQHTFMTAGAFPYHCTIHAAMTGNSVTVDASSANDSVAGGVSIVNSSTPGFSPSAVTIKPGGSVRWKNVSGTTHTVTSGS